MQIYLHNLIFIFRIFLKKKLLKVDKMTRKSSGGSSLNREDESVWSDLQVSRSHIKTFNPIQISIRTVSKFQRINLSIWTFSWSSYLTEKVCPRYGTSSWIKESSLHMMKLPLEYIQVIWYNFLVNMYYISDSLYSYPSFDE